MVRNHSLRICLTGLSCLLGALACAEDTTAPGVATTPTLVPPSGSNNTTAGASGSGSGFVVDNTPSGGAGTPGTAGAPSGGAGTPGTAGTTTVENTAGVNALPNPMNAAGTTTTPDPTPTADPVDNTPPVDEPDPPEEPAGGNPDAEPIIPIDETGWFPAGSNFYGFSGPWYCYDDGVEDTSCVAGDPPWDATEGAMCLTGTTVVDETYASWGGGIAVALMDDDGDKLPFDAADAGIKGFEITVTGTWGDAPLLFKIPTTNKESENNAPEFEIPKAGTYQVDITDLKTSWADTGSVNDEGDTPDASAIYELKFDIKGNEAVSSYSFCITHIEAY